MTPVHKSILQEKCEMENWKCHVFLGKMPEAWLNSTYVLITEKYW